MNIILGIENTQQIKDCYTLLELDTIRFLNENSPVVAYCVIEQLPISEMYAVEQFRDLHQNLIRNYRLANWSYCKDALGHLRGRWAGELDSFYDDLATRVDHHQTHGVESDWDGIVDRR